MAYFRKIPEISAFYQDFAYRAGSRIRQAKSVDKYIPLIGMTPWYQ